MAVVTGAASGVGAATVPELTKRGYVVALADIDDEALAATAAGSPAGSVTPHHVDVRNRQSVDELALRLRSVGRVEFVFANAGIHRDGSLLGGTPTGWQTVVDTNLLGVANTIQAFLPTLYAQNSGDIVVSGSLAGRKPGVGHAMYAATKAAIDQLVQTVRAEIVANRASIRITHLALGNVDTPLIREIPSLEPVVEGGWTLEPQDVARVVGFIVDQPSRVTIPDISIAPTVTTPGRPLRARMRRRLVGRLLGCLP